MSYLRFDDIASGIQVSFDDVQGTGTSANFVETSLQVLDRTRPHHITLQLAAVDGPSNDIVKVWIDGALKITGTSWENYYRYDTEASAEQSPRIVKTVIFRTGGVAAPANLGKGFLFDNVNLSSGPGATYSCAGFESPMDKTVSVGKANRVLPLKMVCTDSTGRVLGPTDIAAPVVQVTKNPTESPTVLTDVDLSAGQGTDGNQFVFDSTSSRWIFNLQTKNFTGSGTYAITAVPGLFDVIDTHPTGTFIVK